MELPSYFTDFLNAIRLTPEQSDACATAHEALRSRLENEEALRSIIVGTFLQGSYRRSTIVRPAPDSRADVDVVVVTSLDENEYTPRQVADLLIPFLDTYYPDEWEEHDRSIRVRAPGDIELDLVITAAPSQVQRELVESDSLREFWTLETAADWRLNDKWVAPARRSLIREAGELVKAALREEEWKSEPLRIPARDLGHWVDTHPLEQIRWTRDKNAATAGHYINAVKSIKWWRQRGGGPKYPKGYPLEHLIGFHCPDGVGGVAEGLTVALESIRDTYRHYPETGQKPSLRDHGVDQDVFARVTVEDFAAFYPLAAAAADAARAALDAPTVRESVQRWRELLGNEFPPPPDDDRGFEAPKGPPQVKPARFG